MNTSKEEGGDRNAHEDSNRNGILYPAKGADPISIPASASPVNQRIHNRRHSNSNSPHRHQHQSGPLNICVHNSPKYLGPSDVNNCYLMVSSPRGHALIINNQEFEQETSYGNHFRHGSQVDASNLEALFQGLGFKVIVQSNLTRNQMTGSLRDFAQIDSHAKCDMAAIAILSHGTEGFMYGADNCAIDIEWVIQQLNNENCPNLRGKPKFFILQSCRGYCEDHGTAPTSQSPIGCLYPNTLADQTSVDAEPIGPRLVFTGEFGDMFSNFGCQLSSRETHRRQVIIRMVV